jgi:hypothetical protein
MLFKVQPVYEYFLQKFRSIYSPGKTFTRLSLDPVKGSLEEIEGHSASIFFPP